MGAAQWLILHSMRGANRLFVRRRMPLNVSWGTYLDVLVVGSFFLVKECRNQALGENYKDKYELG